MSPLHWGSFTRPAAFALALILPLAACQSDDGAQGDEARDAVSTAQELEVSSGPTRDEEIDEIVALVATCDPAQWQALEAFEKERLRDVAWEPYEFWSWVTQEWLACPDIRTRIQVAESGLIPHYALVELMRDEDPRVLSALQSNHYALSRALWRLAKDEDESMRLLAARFNETSPDVLERLVRDPSPNVRDAAIQNFLKHPSLCGDNIDFDLYFGRYMEKSGSWWEGETSSGRLLIAVPEIAGADDCRFTLVFPGDPEPINGQWQQSGLTLNLEVGNAELRTLAGSVRDNVLRLELDGEAFAKLLPRPMPGREVSAEAADASP